MVANKENYIYQVFQSQLGRYPAVCRHEIDNPSAEHFELEYVPPQYDPEAVRDEDPDLYDKIQAYIIDCHLGRYSTRRQKRIETALWSVFQTLDEHACRNLIGKYLMLSGRRHHLSDWAFIGEGRWKQKLRHRMSQIHEDLVPVIRTALVNFAYQDQEIGDDILLFMRLMLGE